jgi:hypothetical protein
MPRWLFITLVVAFLLGAFFRLVNLSQTALTTWDDAWYSLVANTFVLMPGWWAKIVTGTDPKQAWEQIYSWGFYPHLSFKPAFITLLVLAKAVSGGATAKAGLWLSPVLGLLTMGVVYKLMRSLGHSQHLALAALVLCAVGGIPVLYSRMLFPHQLAALALATWLWLYLQTLTPSPLPKRQTLWIGLGIGTLLTTHDMMLPIIVLLTFTELAVMVWRACGDSPVDFAKFWYWPLYWLRHWERPALLLLGVSLPIGFWELVIVGLRKFLHRTLHKGYVMPYHQEVFAHVTDHPVSAAQYVHHGSQMDYGYFFKALNLTEGWLFVTVLVIGLGVLLWWLIKPKSARWTVFALITLCCFGMVCAFHDKMLRLIAPFYPLLWVTAVTGVGYLAFGLYWLFEVKLRPSEFSAHRWPQSLWRWTYLIVLVTLFLQMSSKRLFEPFWQNNGFKDTSNYMADRILPGEAMATPYRAPVYTAYLGQRVYKFRSQADLDTLIRTKNVRWVVFDLEQTSKLCHHQPALCDNDVEASQTIDALEDNMNLYLWKTIPNPLGASQVSLLERHWTWDTTTWAHKNASTLALDKIRIYWIPAPSGNP